MRRIALTICILLFTALVLMQSALAGGVLYPFYDGESYRLMDSGGSIVEDLKCDYLTQLRTQDGTVRFIAYISEKGISHAELLNENGDTLTSGEYDAIYYENGVFMTISGELFGIIDRDGNELLPTQYTSIVPTGEDTFFTSTDDPSDGIADELYLTGTDGTSSYICACQGFMGSFSEGLLCAASRDGKYGYMNASGQWVIAPVYDAANDFSGGVAVIMRGTSYGLIDKSGKLILPIRYDCISAWTAGDELSMVIAILDDSATIYDRATMLPLKTLNNVTYAYMPTDSIALLGSDNLTRIYNFREKSVTLEVDAALSVEVLNDERALITDYEGGNARISDISGSGAQDICFSGITGAYGMYDDDGACTICVSHEDGDHTLWGVYSLDGAEILPVEYDSVTHSCADVFSVQQGTSSGLIRSDGQWIFRVTRE